MNFTIMPHTAAEATSTNATGSSILLIVLYLVIIIGAMYLLLIRPQRKKQKEEQKMRDSIQIGDEIITIGGIYGRIISIKEDSFVMESQSDHSKLTFARWALQTNLTVHDDAPLKKK